MEDIDDIVLLRDAMDRSADGLPPLPDLAPLAVREGRRRRARSRLAAGTAAFAVVTAGALGLTLFPGSGGGVAVPAASTVAGLSPEEREFREEYRRKMASLLDERLPVAVTGVRPEGDRVSEYRFESGGETFRMVVSVRRTADSSLWQKAPELKLGSISELNGRVHVRYTYHRSEVALIVYDDDADVPFSPADLVPLDHGPHSPKSVTTDVPVSASELFPVTRDPRFVELVKEADAHPMEENDPALDPMFVDADFPSLPEGVGHHFAR
ncbi:hypothetical protein ACFYOG_02635 [Streptomyces sp. NPDC007818]|uniref:hypothetical protein n=1 Tax=Streptomyces sp. NPDC007818 TaxID=3364780 RepID=UPI0036814D90